MFYTYRQNNSGGRFGQPAIQVIVEADTPEQADVVAQSRGLYFNGVDNDYDCPCCGDRWYPASSWDESAEPVIYGQSIQDYLDDDKTIKWSKWDDVPEVLVVYKDGREEQYD